ncbi:hypothetical protein [Methanogenium cariaci]|uniref:hypothetical protein n=1 Tax=Methanogenium cariaci TaxID=2197 RepID=UPI000785FCD6|nr:hypothetical protein [Methanogenium cariaci]
MSRFYVAAGAAHPLYICCNGANVAPPAIGEGARVRADAGPAMMEPGRGVVPPLAGRWCRQIQPAGRAGRVSSLKRA